MGGFSGFGLLLAGACVRAVAAAAAAAEARLGAGICVGISNGTAETREGSVAAWQR